MKTYKTPVTRLLASEVTSAMLANSQYVTTAPGTISTNVISGTTNVQLSRQVTFSD